jgi:hypothetical protein
MTELFFNPERAALCPRTNALDQRTGVDDSSGLITLYLDPTPATLSGSLNNRETETRSPAIALGGEESFKQVLLILRADPRPVVSHPEMQQFAFGIGVPTQE